MPQTTARALAELVLNMDMATDKGLMARSLARQVLGIPDGADPDLVPITTNGTMRLVHRDEPVLLLRGQDVAGGAATRGWAAIARSFGAGDAIVVSAQEHAAKMDAWPVKKIPDLPGA